ncbi:MAG: hypothetical protein M3371_06255 [Acidobacteriota bacterium]|nr:hypothetical protein [Acidobacteriota bacterium]
MAIGGLEALTVAAGRSSLTRQMGISVRLRLPGEDRHRPSSWSDAVRACPLVKL